MPQIPELQKYYSLLTPYAFSFLKKQFEYEDKSNTLQITNEYTCNCIFYNSMKLPCRHILKIRNLSLTPLFDAGVCDKRWTRDYYYKNQRVFKNVEAVHYDSNTTVSILHRKKIRVPSTHEKFRKASIIGAKIADLVSRSSNIHYRRKIEQLEFLFNAWLKGQELILHILGADDEVIDVVEECCVNNDVVDADEGNFEVVEDGDNFELVEDGDNFEVVADGMVIEDIVSVEKCDVFVEGADVIDVMENIHVTSKLSRSQGIKSIILLTKKRTCGRPKGAVLTTISLPKKRLRSGQKTETKTKKKRKYDDIAVDPDDVVDVNNMIMENDIVDAVETVDSEHCNSQGNYPIIVESIILPGKVRTCGRPKGAIMTTIGLPKRLRTERTLAQKPETKTKKIEKRDTAVNSDEPTYCLCNQISYGKMIFCDNDLFPVEWFHFSCVSLSTKPKGKWFCPKCRGDRPNKMKPKAQFLKKLELYNKEKEDTA